ncbi:MAG: hypothetical protein EAZ06_05275 [Cytophagales bacterium]|nr:MAG: hypothetical protein EAZ06_05275 [Cytophagales bacterium]
MKKNNLIFCITIFTLLTSCFSKSYPDPPTFILGIKFVDSNGKRIKSPYSKVYERTILTNIDSLSIVRGAMFLDSLHYSLPFPTVNIPKELSFIFEKPNGQKDSVTISYTVTQRYIDRRTGTTNVYDNIDVVMSSTSFSPNNITKIPSTPNYVLKITL